MRREKWDHIAEVPIFFTCAEKKQRNEAKCKGWKVFTLDEHTRTERERVDDEKMIVSKPGTWDSGSSRIAVKF